MIEITCALIGFFIGYKLATLKVEKIVKKEIERQLHTLSDWTMKSDN